MKVLKVATGLIALALISGCVTDNTASLGTDNSQKQFETVSVTPTPQKGAKPTMEPDVKELKIEDIKVGTGAEAKSGDHVTVHYTGTLLDGTKFDSSKDRGTPFDFDLGAGQVIKGWDQGVAGMKIGGTRKLVIPATLGYGAQAVGSIPANSTLVFEVELLKVN